MDSDRQGDTMHEGYGRASVRWGWSLSALYLVHAVVSTNMPRTDKLLPAREVLRGWHYLLGSAILVVVILRLLAWRRDGAVKPPAGISGAAWSWARALALGSYLLLLAAPFLGVLYAWSDGLGIHLGPTPVLPALVEENRPLWMFTGYFHSGLGFMLIMLNFAALISASYILMRYGRGLLSGFPPGYGAMALAGASTTVYAFATFRSPDPGIPALLVFWGIVTAVWLAARWLWRRSAGSSEPRAAVPSSPSAKLAAAVGVAGLIGFGAYGPNLLFRVTPWPATEAILSVDGATWHAAPVMTVSATPANAAERRVAAETFKWCGFCHTMNKGEPHRVGPNLYAIFGQKAGTVPGFSYSPALLEARDKGLVWNDKSIAQYIAGPDEFLPGTTMIISSGPVRDPVDRAAVINLLKRATMPAGN